MDTQPSKKKVAALYDLRDAAEAKAKAQVAVENESTPGTRDALLDAQIELENKTADAVEACHECDETSHDHPPTGGGTPAEREPVGDRSNVIDVDFGGRAKSA